MRKEGMINELDALKECVSRATASALSNSQSIDTLAEAFVSTLNDEQSFGDNETIIATLSGLFIEASEHADHAAAVTMHAYNAALNNGLTLSEAYALSLEGINAARDHNDLAVNALFNFSSELDNAYEQGIQDIMFLEACLSAALSSVYSVDASLVMALRCIYQCEAVLEQTLEEMNNDLANISTYPTDRSSRQSP